MKYRMLNGKIVGADSPRQLAEIMNEKESAKRAQIYSGSIIRCTTVEEHIEDLIAAGFITPVE